MTRVLAVVLALAAVVLAGCASVPSSSPVQVLRQVSGGEAATPPAPKPGGELADFVKDFVTASASSADKHAAARRFLTPEAAQKWDDGTSVTILDGGVTPIQTSQSGDTVRASILGSVIGVVGADGAFEPGERRLDNDIVLDHRGGQWRISQLPDGVVVELSTFLSTYRQADVWFVDPTRHLVVADIRYIARKPQQAQPGQLMTLLLGGPSSSLTGVVGTQLPADEVKLRSNVVVAPDNTATVDLTGVRALDDTSRRLLAAQVVLTVLAAEVDGVNLLVDGAPFDPATPVWRRADVQPMIGEAAVATNAPALVTSAGRIGELSGTVPLSPFPGPAGDGRITALSAGISVDGSALAIVARGGPGAQLFLGKVADGSIGEQPLLSAATMTRPTWAPGGDEVWTVLDGTDVRRVHIDRSGATTVDTVDPGVLASDGPITELRLSRDGVRVLAVAGGGLYVGAVEHPLKGIVAIKDVRRLRPSLGAVAAADWREVDSVVAVTSGAEMVVKVQVDGLLTTPQLTGNLVSAPTAVASARPDLPILVTNQYGLWSYAGGTQNSWKQVQGGQAGSVPSYPG
jgi:hypothetical protein